MAEDSLQRRVALVRIDNPSLEIAMLQERVRELEAVQADYHRYWHHMGEALSKSRQANGELTALVARLTYLRMPTYEVLAKVVCVGPERFTLPAPFPHGRVEAEPGEVLGFVKFL